MNPDKEMRVMHLSTSRASGGAERRTLELAHCLREEGVRCTIAADKRAYIYQRATALGLEAHHVALRGSLDPIGIWLLWRIVVRNAIRVVHCHDSRAFWPCVLVKWMRLGKLKLVFHRRIQKRHSLVSRYHYRFADAVVAVSRAVEDVLIHIDRVPPQKVHVIYDGVDTKVFNPGVCGEEVRQTYGIRGKLVVGTAGPMNRDYHKGQPLLLEAAGILAKEFPRAVFLLIGAGNLEEGLKERAAQLEIADKVFFPGYREDIERFMAAMDIFCLGSFLHEGLGNVLMEAQAMGKPVVGTDVGGIRETFLDGETGILIPKEDLAALTGALRRLLSDESGRLKMGRKASVFAETRFGTRVMVAEVLSIYEQICT